MAKLPPIERFRVTTFVPKELLGEVMAALTRLGLNEVSFDLVADVPSFARNAKPEVPNTEFLAAWVAEHPTFKAVEAVRAFEADGRSKTQTYPAIATLVEKGILTKLGPGEYSRADVKHLPAPKTSTKTPSQSINKYAISNGDFILRCARRSHGRTSTTSLRKLFVADKRVSSSISPTLNSLVRAKQIKRVGEGEYVLLAKAAKAKPEKPPKLNGAGHVATESAAVEVTHG